MGREPQLRDFPWTTTRTRTMRCSFSSARHWGGKRYSSKAGATHSQTLWANYKRPIIVKIWPPKFPRKMFVWIELLAQINIDIGNWLLCSGRADNVRPWYDHNGWLYWLTIERCRQKHHLMRRLFHNRRDHLCLPLILPCIGSDANDR